MNDMRKLMEAIEEANQGGKTEHSGAKKGKGAYYGRKKEAKRDSNKNRRNADKSATKNIDEDKNSAALHVVNAKYAQLFGDLVDLVSDAQAERILHPQELLNNLQALVRKHDRKLQLTKGISEEYGARTVFNSREYTTKMHDLMDMGMLSPRVVADAALNHMSEEEVKDMAESNNFLDDEYYGE